MAINDSTLPVMKVLGSVYENITYDESGTVIKQFESASEEYDTLLNGVALRDASQCAFIELQGKDTLDFLHRVTTNSLKDLQNGGLSSTLFTNEKGRIIDRTTVINRDNNIWLLGSAVFRNKLVSWINKYIIMEDIKTIDLTDSYFKFELLGSQCPSFLSMIFGNIVDSIQMNTIRKIQLEGYEFFVFRKMELDLNKYVIIGKIEDSEFFLKYMLEQKSVFDFRPVGQEAYDIQRILKGIPSAPQEINDTYNPHEVNLTEDVSFTKGCYIGQEVIARLDTYNKIQKKLTPVIFNDDEVDIVFPMKVLNLNHDEIGQITSCGRTYHVKKNVALAIIRKDFSTEGTELTVINGNNHEYRAKACSLPLKK